MNSIPKNNLDVNKEDSVEEETKEKQIKTLHSQYSDSVSEKMTVS